MNIKVDNYIESKEIWKNELIKIRSVLKELPLEETIKWGAPTYVYGKKKWLVSLHLKTIVASGFFQGALLKDKNKVLLNAQEGKTKTMLQWRFNSIEEIDIDLIKSYVLEAIENIEKVIEIKPKKDTSKIKIPEELLYELNKNSKLNECFKSLTVSKQRECVNFITEAKRESTKTKRLEKILPMIFEKKGLYDKYKNC